MTLNKLVCPVPVRSGESRTVALWTHALAFFLLRSQRWTPPS